MNRKPMSSADWAQLFERLALGVAVLALDPPEHWPQDVVQRVRDQLLGLDLGVVTHGGHRAALDAAHGLLQRGGRHGVRELVGAMGSDALLFRFAGGAETYIRARAEAIWTDPGCLGPALAGLQRQAHVRALQAAADALGAACRRGDPAPAVRRLAELINGPATGIHAA